MWIDHEPAGTAPVTVHVAAGRHVVAAGAGGARDATRLVVAPPAQTVTLALADQRGPWSEVAGLVKAWRDGVSTPDAAALGAIMATAKVRFAVVLAGARTAEVWAMNTGDTAAKKLDAASMDAVLELAAMVTDRIAGWDGRAPDPEGLLVETPEERARRYGERDKRTTRTRWYVYASIAGAFVLGGIIIYANDSATDTQRIVITGP